ncbi:MAG TPA: O-antigen ligase family protein, partial [Flavobacterium sp.]
MLFFISFLLVFPIDLNQQVTGGIDLPISMILIIPSLKYFLLTKNKSKINLELSIILSILGILIIQVLFTSYTLRPYLSFIFFFLPILSYFYSIRIIRNEISLLTFLKFLSINIIIFTVFYFASILLQFNGVVRDEGTLNGNFLGLKLAGVYGVHTLGAQLFIFIFILIFNLIINKPNILFRIFSVISCLILLYIILMSLSRELVLGLIIFFGFLLVKKYGYIKSFTILTFLSGLIYLGFSNLINSIWQVWETKISVGKEATNLNELSSGRLDLQYLAITQLITNPFFGTGFQGYLLNYKSYKGYETLEGWSTHIYFLTALWKMGIIAFTFYSLFFLKILKDVFKYKYLDYNSKSIFIAFIISFLIVNLFWDALLAPNIMILFMFIIGMLSFKNKDYNNKSKIVENIYV